MTIPAEVHVWADVEDYDVLLVGEYLPEGGRFEARELTVKRKEGGREVTGEGVRQLPVARILRAGAGHALRRAMETVNGPTPQPAELADGPTDETLRWVARGGADSLPNSTSSAGPTDETLRAVARLYRYALMMGSSPTNAVAIGLDVPRSTAGRWVTRARDRGLLTVQDRRGGHSRADG